jgi:hypothetical protein
VTRNPLPDSSGSHHRKKGQLWEKPQLPDVPCPHWMPRLLAHAGPATHMAASNTFYPGVRIPEHKDTVVFNMETARSFLSPSADTCPLSSQNQPTLPLCQAGEPGANAQSQTGRTRGDLCESPRPRAEPQGHLAHLRLGWI